MGFSGVLGSSAGAFGMNYLANNNYVRLESPPRPRPLPRPNMIIPDLAAFCFLNLVFENSLMATYLLASLS